MRQRKNSGAHKSSVAGFLGSIPLILVLAGIYYRENLLLKQILGQLKELGGRVTAIEQWMVKIERRLTTLETRAGIIFHE